LSSPTGTIAKQRRIRALYQNCQNNPLLRGEEGGNWKIVQNGFREIIYSA
jgi:hypothetical protein